MTNTIRHASYDSHSRIIDPSFIQPNASPASHHIKWRTCREISLGLFVLWPVPFLCGQRTLCSLHPASGHHDVAPVTVRDRTCSFILIQCDLLIESLQLCLPCFFMYPMTLSVHVQPPWSLAYWLPVAVHRLGSAQAPPIRPIYTFS